MQPVSKTYNEYLVTTDKNQLQPLAIHKWLSEESYWAQGVSFDTVKRSIDNSFCIGILCNKEQIGFGRLITDYATFAYLADVYVQQEHRGKGLSKLMMQLLFEQDWVKELRGVMLATRDAHGLYKQFGFAALETPERYMKRRLII
jgi:GNAT superfamily N-acetyltransferase